MGLEIALGIAAIAASLGSAGASVAQSREATRQAKDATRDQENAVLAQTANTNAKESIAQKGDALRMARARQQALSAAQSGYAGTILANQPSSMGGSPAAPSAGTKTQLGQ